MSPCLTRKTKSGGFLAPLSWPSAETKGLFEPFSKAICHGWRMPVAKIFKPLPSAFIDRMSYTYGLFAGPWSLPLSKPTSTPTNSRPFGANAIPLKPWKPFGAVQIAVRLANVFPLKPLQRWIAQTGPFFVSVPPATYSALLCHARPDTKFGDPASLMPLPPLSRYTPPLGTLLDSLPPSPSNTLPAPTANEVGVCRPEATWVTVWPPGAVGGGGGPAAAAAVAPTPSTALAVTASAVIFTRI